jgi:hypothetical protein
MQADGFGIFPGGKTHKQAIINATTAAAGQGYDAFHVPRSASMLNIILIGAGAGGGAGFLAAAGNPRGGGGGGACSSIARLTIPTIALPEVLYCQVAAGGKGGTASGNGGAPVGTIISAYPVTGVVATPNQILMGTAGNLPQGGTAGTAAAAGAGGTIPNVSAVQPLHVFGAWSVLAGIAGTAGGVHTGANGGSTTCWTAFPLSPGAGGAGVTGTGFFGGGQITGAIVNLGRIQYPNATNVAAGGGVSNINGADGVKFLYPLLTCGGSGALSSNTGAGGAGGKGGWGSGGGGGGGGVTGGAGGDGGDGIIIINWW